MSLGSREPSACSLQTDMIIFITLEDFFFPAGISVTRLFGSVSVCMSAVCPQALYFLQKISMGA